MGENTLNSVTVRYGLAPEDHQRVREQQLRHLEVGRAGRVTAGVVLLLTALLTVWMFVLLQPDRWFEWFLPLSPGVVVAFLLWRIFRPEDARESITWRQEAHTCSLYPDGVWFSTDDGPAQKLAWAEITSVAQEAEFVVVRTRQLQYPIPVTAFAPDTLEAFLKFAREHMKTGSTTINANEPSTAIHFDLGIRDAGMFLGLTPAVIAGRMLVSGIAWASLPLIAALAIEPGYENSTSIRDSMSALAVGLAIAGAIGAFVGARRRIRKAAGPRSVWIDAKNIYSTRIDMEVRIPLDQVSAVGTLGRFAWADGAGVRIMVPQSAVSTVHPLGLFLTARLGATSARTDAVPA